VRIRLHGTPEEVTAALGRVEAAFEVVAVSGPYPDRGRSQLVRVYVEARLEHLFPGAEAAQEPRSHPPEGEDTPPGGSGPPGAEERPAEPGELCTCGRPAVVVYLGGVFGPTGWCGRSDGGEVAGPCPFCGGPRHEGRCPDYRLRLDRARG
jgi:hypothetical protein